MTRGDHKIIGEEKRAINEVIDSGQISEGRKARECEKLLQTVSGKMHFI